jgi:hypothetical protein
VVQACHASLEAARAFLPDPDPHPFVIVCGIRDEPKLCRALDRLRAHEIRYRAFYEPDLDGQLTAVATEPVFGHQRHVFRQYQLLADDSCRGRAARQDLSRE